ncbi:hypothetical protein GEMRC1_013718 [Eukaryota sp. GEM-RC1]
MNFASPKSTTSKFTPVNDTDGEIIAISANPQYKDKTSEQIRLNDYQTLGKLSGSQPSAFRPTRSPFGGSFGAPSFGTQGTQQVTSSFATPSTSAPFGQPQRFSTSLFGQPPQPQQQQTPSLFGSASGSSTPSFGQTIQPQQQTPSLFGSAPGSSTPSFGQTTQPQQSMFTSHNERVDCTCKICLENYSHNRHRPMIICTNGHSVCQECSSQISQCPLCPSPLLPVFPPNLNIVEALSAAESGELSSEIPIHHPNLNSRSKTVDDKYQELEAVNGQIAESLRELKQINYELTSLQHKKSRLCIETHALEQRLKQALDILNIDSSPTVSSPPIQLKPKVNQPPSNPFSTPSSTSCCTSNPFGASPPSFPLPLITGTYNKRHLNRLKPSVNNSPPVIQAESNAHSHSNQSQQEKPNSNIPCDLGTQDERILSSTSHRVQVSKPTTSVLPKSNKDHSSSVCSSFPTFKLVLIGDGGGWEVNFNNPPHNG